MSLTSEETKRALSLLYAYQHVRFKKEKGFAKRRRKEWRVPVYSTVS